MTARRIPQYSPTSSRLHRVLLARLHRELFTIDMTRRQRLVLNELLSRLHRSAAVTSDTHSQVEPVQVKENLRRVP